MSSEQVNLDIAAVPNPSINGSSPEIRVPHHIAIIMDGNARWAEKNGLTVAQGHRAGYENIEHVTRAMAKKGVKEATLFAFSTENWDRPATEVEAIMELATEAVRSGIDRFHSQGVKLRHVGYEQRLPAAMIAKIKEAEELTCNNDRFGLNLAFDYGGRHEIVNAIRQIVAEGVLPEKIDEELVDDYLFTSGMPDPDMIIRTGGEYRISNFMIWQSAYSEFYSSPAMWPDFGEEELDAAIRAYSHRQRRFGRRPERQR